MTSAVAIVGMACEYADARSPAELWENVLAQRRAFRQIPAERLLLDDYFSPDRQQPDSIYSRDAALIEGYTFDRVRFRVSGAAFRSADLAHWLALDVASRSLADAGFAGGDGLPRETTGVLVGNTLTGELTRANLLRVRWPYVRRVTDATLSEHGWPASDRQTVLGRLEDAYKAPFPPVDEETLAGGLSNTIAGRICNHFDLKGGGYTVDGACAASLLATAAACSSLVAGDVDVAVAGGVDVSLDPFELVGFAKAGALAADEMRVFDVRSDGFSPGEGCGFVVLMRYADALAARRRIYAVIRGWGISSDGSGGITRPEIEGQLLAMRRAYRRAGFDIATVPYFEAHGTGTSVGDATELRALSRAIREAGPTGGRAAIGSVKANIGHTKAAAGIAGVIKATMAVHTQIVPPATGCDQPHPELTAACAPLRAPGAGEPWPFDRPLRAGVSAMGFGGCNAHLVIEGTASERRSTLTRAERELLSSAQDAELLLLSGGSIADLRRHAEHLLSIAPRLSRSELTDLAAHTHATVENGEARAAVVASTPRELASRLQQLLSQSALPLRAPLDPGAGFFVGTPRIPPRIGFLFPGQGSPSYATGGAWARRFASVRRLYEGESVAPGADLSRTELAQPLIALASLAGLRTLETLGVVASVGIGHSLGELTALHWGGALTEEMLRRIARARGLAMAEASHGGGAMVSIAAPPGEIVTLLRDDSVAIAAFNSPRQTVVSGIASEVAAVASRAHARGLRCTPLPVSHAFHSALVAPAADRLARELAQHSFQPLSRAVISTVTGAPLDRHADVRQLLCDQVTSPVRFLDGVTKAAEQVDLFIEAGPGRVLSGLASECANAPAIALDAAGPSLDGLLKAVGAAWVLGAAINREALLADRFVRPFTLPWRPRFFVNPCERAPAPVGSVNARPKPVFNEASREEAKPADASSEAALSALDLLRQLVAVRAELPLSAVRGDCRLLSDLHLNSITVSQLVLEAARRLGLPPPVAPTEYADATILQVANALQESARMGGPRSHDGDAGVPAGVDTWVRAFIVEDVERPAAKRRAATVQGSWRVVSRAGDDLADALRAELAGHAGAGAIVCLPPDPEERDLPLLLDGARTALAEKGPARFVVVQHQGGGSGFARSLHLERPDIATCVVDVPHRHPNAVDWIVTEATGVVGFTEARYDTDGRRTEPHLRTLALSGEPRVVPFGSDDVLLVTGGGKGIGAECAFALARQTGVRLALVGRGRPGKDAALAANLERMSAAGIRLQYVTADVTDERAVRAAVRDVEAAAGPITAILHAAGANTPQLLSALDEKDFVDTLRPKVHGARNVLSAIDRGRLRAFVTFGSIIARTGMRGEAHYALANEWLARLTEELQRQHPECRCLAVEWSVWAGAGMGERLGRLDALVREGITPIPIDRGVSTLLQLIAAPMPAVRVVVTGRLGTASPLTLDRADLPILRFLERPRVDYPNIELVADAAVSLPTDPYLRDHVFQGNHLFPAVMGLEAMAQAASALLGTADSLTFEQVAFERGIVVPERGSLVVRVAGLERREGRIDLVLRTEATAFQVDHFRATCVLPSRERGSPAPLRRPEPPDEVLALDPAQDLYGGLLFQAGRFARLLQFRRLTATECVADISAGASASWFSQYLPERLVLGDPGARDASLHAVQACIPHAVVLPVGVARIATGMCPAARISRVHAWERARDGDVLVYDLEMAGPEGEICERWEGLRLRVVGTRANPGEWPPLLLAPYLERKVHDLIPGAPVRVAIEAAGTGDDRRSRSDRIVRRLTGPAAGLRRRPDGRPELIGEPESSVSVAHAPEITVAVTGQGTLACDVELLSPRDDPEWTALIGAARAPLAGVIAAGAGEDYAAAAARVWAAIECSRKAGVAVDAPIVVDSIGADGWVVLRCGSLLTATHVARVRGVPHRMVLALLATELPCERMSTAT